MVNSVAKNYCNKHVVRRKNKNCSVSRKKVANLKQKANTLTKSLTNFSTRRKAVEECKKKLIEKEKVRTLQTENKIQLENATDAAPKHGETERAA